MARLLLVSNRLPVTVKTDGDTVEVIPSAGGLATGLSGPHQRSGGVWVGWPGDVSKVSAPRLETLENELSKLRCVPLYLSADEVDRFYEGFSNRVLWPLFHYMLDHIPEHARDWDEYRRVNERFAERIAGQYQLGDTIWVQDYQLCLLPGLLRKRLPQARIGFFLHIPFPSSEVFRTLPWRTALLEGLLGADLLGFHTLSYLRHFSNALVHVLGLRPDVDQVRFEGRQIQLGAFPMGIDAQAFSQAAGRDDVRAEVALLRETTEGRKILLGIDRLDYTKGIPRRLLAVERLLERAPSLRSAIRFIQVAVPSRTGVVDYELLRHQVDELVGRINGKFGSVHHTPIRYLYQSVPFHQLVALYRAADVMLVNPLRDGMNLVAKEFVAARDDGDGVLVLSELAGAASELGEAVLVNPYDVEGIADAIEAALEMPEEERRLRMQALRSRVMAHDVHRWVSTYLERLEGLSPTENPPAATFTDSARVGAVVEQLRKAPRLCLLLDYDGTLRDFTTLPELATPEPALIELLRRLASRPGTSITVVSGRRMDFLERYLGGLPIGLCAEHGLYYRPHPSEKWFPLREVDISWKERVRPILNTFVDRTPGSFVEEKKASVAWHYRKAEPQFAQAQARELQLHLSTMFSNAPVELLAGSKVVEVRSQGVHKGLVVPAVLERFGGGALVCAAGDDNTDEDLFAAVPTGAISIHVGPRPSMAEIRVRNVAAMRELLSALTEVPMRSGV